MDLVPEAQVSAFENATAIEKKWDQDMNYASIRETRFSERSLLTKSSLGCTLTKICKKMAIK